MNRIDRISAILILLQSRRTVRAQDIAERFHISLRTVYRDIRTLETAGVPLIGEAGVGYALMEGYRLPPVMFSREEATAFITAEKLVCSLTDQPNSTAYSFAMDKIRAVMQNSDKKYLEEIEHKIKVIKTIRHADHQAMPGAMQTALQAIASRQVMQLNYFTYYRQEHTIRDIEPVGIFYLDKYWHLIAFCRQRNDYRDFRFDRITALTALQEKFHPVHLSLKDYLEQQQRESPLIAVRLRVTAQASLHLGEQKYYMGYIAERPAPEGIDMQFLTQSLEGFARWYLSIADHAVILEPALLKEKVRALFDVIAEKNNFFIPC